MGFTFYFNIRTLSLRGPPGAASASYKRPCSFWFGEDYPFSSPYDIDPGVNRTNFRDGSFIAMPLGGWLNVLSDPSLANVSTISTFTVNQQRAGSIVGFDSKISQKLLGSAPMQDPIFFQNLNEILQETQKPSYSAAKPEGGILDTIANRFFIDYVEIDNRTATGSFESFVQPISIFKFPYYNVSSTMTDNDIDDAISQAITYSLAQVAKIDKSALLRSEANILKTNLFMTLTQLLKDLPYGGIYFKSIDHANLAYGWIFHYGTDVRLTSSTNFPAPGIRLLTQQVFLDNSILRSSNPASLGSAKITQGFRIMPQVANSQINLQVGSLIGGILYPFGVSFLLPLFVVVLVQEKENRILVMMKMNGVKSVAYYISHYATFYTLYAISTIFFLLSGVIVKLTFFVSTEKSVIALLFFVWGKFYRLTLS